MDEESIFAKAIRIRSADERREFLDKACAGNDKLRSDVESLLEAHAAAGSFLNQPPVADDTVDSEVSQNQLHFLDPCDSPDRIGKLGVYEIIEVVGRGGMGIVLRAYDTKLRRTVAVKVLAPELAADPMAVKRFLSKAQKAAAVVHDHVVTIHAVDDAHRPPFLVMEFVEGQSLQDKIDREGALQLIPILRIATQIAEGLAVAHQRGLIHRDVKPANILLENSIEHAKIADFGLARAADDANITAEGRVTGTPLYMSPEQARGEAVDHRTDLFSLGSVIYTMCVGRPAFRADSHLAVMRRVCEDTPREIRDLNPDSPDWLTTVVGRLLEKDPGQRCQSANHVATLLGNQLAHVQAGSQMSIPNNPARVPNQEPGSRLKRKYLPRVLAAVVAAAVFAGIGWFFVPKPPHPDAVQWLASEGGNGHWYAVVTTPQGVRWDEAERLAEKMGGHLVTITSKAEEDFVIRLTNDGRFWSVSPGSSKDGPWIGALQIDEGREPDGGWRWVTGEPFLYSNWSNRQPNDNKEALTRQQNIRYVAPEGNWLSASWGDGSTPKRSFLVEWDAYLPLTENDHPKQDHYGVLFVQHVPSDADEWHIVFLDEQDGTVRRTSFGPPLAYFVPPRRYVWQIVDPKDERQIGRGIIDVKAGDRIVFTPEGPELEQVTVDR